MWSGGGGGDLRELLEASHAVNDLLTIRSHSSHTYRTMHQALNGRDWHRLKSVIQSYKLLLWFPGLESADANTKRIEIEYIVYHNSSYRGGGGYRKFGGYDITLLKLGKPANM